MIIKILKMLLVIFQMPRWKEYEEILKYALNNGYIVTSLIDWYLHYKDNQNYKVLILRHDIDYSIKGTTKMLEIERKLGLNKLYNKLKEYEDHLKNKTIPKIIFGGVRSTFYFRWSTANKKLIKEIKEYGSEVGLHYETLASYAIKNNIYKKSEFTEKDLVNCQEELKKEIKKFKDLFGEIYSAASHGHERNRMLGIPNNILVEGVNLQEFGLVLEAYNKEINELFDIYISDGSIFDGYWKYGISPCEAIDKQIPTILLLTHPIHWNHNPLKQLLNLGHLLIAKIKNKMKKGG